MSNKRPKSASISFTALYTGAVWQHNQLGDPSLATGSGEFLYRVLQPFEQLSEWTFGSNMRTFLLQRHQMIDDQISRRVESGEIRWVQEIACGLSPRGLRLRSRFPRLNMIEADLPDMASRKAAVLAQKGALGDHHQVTPMDILDDASGQSPAAVIERLIPEGEPVIVVTEGLTPYFSLDVISGFWKQLASALASRPGSLYLTDTYRLPGGGVSQRTFSTLAGGLSLITRSRVSFHFASSDIARQHMEQMGFDRCEALNPADFWDVLPIPKTRQAPLMRILACHVDGTARRPDADPVESGT